MNKPSLVVSIKIRRVSNSQMQRLQSLIGSHFLFARYDIHYQFTIYARTLRGFSLSGTVATYEELLRDFDPEVSLVRAYLPVHSNALKGGPTC